MRGMMLQLWRDERGIVISVELVLVTTLAVLSTVVGLSEATVALNAELNDISSAIGAMNQTYFATGFQALSTQSSGGEVVKSGFNGSFFQDAVDDCDVSKIDLIGTTEYGGSTGG